MQRIQVLLHAKTINLSNIMSASRRLSGRNTISPTLNDISTKADDAGTLRYSAATFASKGMCNCWSFRYRSGSVLQSVYGWFRQSFLSSSSCCCTGGGIVVFNRHKIQEVINSMAFLGGRGVHFYAIG